MKAKEYFYEERPGFRYIDVNSNEHSIIHGPIGVIKLPKVTTCKFVNLVFVDQGDYEIQSESAKFIVGTKEYSVIKTLPGKENFNTHVEFVFSVKRNSWVILSSGNVIVPDEEINNDSNPKID